METIKDFIVVEFIRDTESDDIEIDVVRKEWLIDESLVYFPSSTKYNKAVRTHLAHTDICSWKSYPIKILRTFETYKSAREYSDIQSGFSSSSDERAARDAKLQKRKHPIMSSGLPDLRELAQKSKATTVTIAPPAPIVAVESQSKESTSYNQAQSNENYQLDNEPEYVEMDQIDPQYEILGNQNELVNNESFTLVSSQQLNEIMKMIAQLTVDVAYIKTNMVQKSQSNRAATTFVKVKNEEEFQDFIKSLENQDQVDLMAERLKRLPASEKCKVTLNGRVLSILLYLFDKDFLKKLTWGQKNGPVANEKLALVNFPTFGALMHSALEGTEPEKLRHAIQGVFKAHIKKFL